MSIECQMYLNKNQTLNRDPSFIYELDKIMREKYKLTLPDKLDRFKNKLDMFSTFIDIFN